jgi:putative oxidoreductase
MTIQATSSPSSALSALDRIAAGATDLWLLIGRILLCWIFIAVVWGNIINGVGGSIAYFTSLKMPAPDMMIWLVLLAEVLISISLVLGFATRYGAALAILFVIIATFTAHRYWEYTGPAQIVNYNYFLKNLSMIGGFLYLFVFGPGRFSVDARMSNR